MFSQRHPGSGATLNPPLRCSKCRKRSRLDGKGHVHRVRPMPRLDTGGGGVCSARGHSLDFDDTPRGFLVCMRARRWCGRVRGREWSGLQPRRVTAIVGPAMRYACRSANRSIQPSSTRAALSHPTRAEPMARRQQRQSCSGFERRKSSAIRRVRQTRPRGGSCSPVNGAWTKRTMSAPPR